MNRARQVVAGESSEAITLRRWEAAKTHRLNEAHWVGATGNGINRDLVSDLETLRTRAAYEAANNPMLEGVIFTHQVDLVGMDGPRLQVQIDGDDRLNDELEQAWEEWWQDPDAAGQLGGVELLDQWVHSLWANGEFLAQIVTDEGAQTPVKTRLLTLEPRRMVSPVKLVGADDVVMGVRRTRLGRPVGYFITPDSGSGLSVGLPSDAAEVPASDIVHGFRCIEAGQARGVPWAASGLQVVADLRDYDAEVLQVARQAANHGVALWTRHPDAPFLSVNESAEIERGTYTTMPPGWEPKEVKPEQPSTKYIDYRAERHRELGRPVGMPLMAVRLDASGHNFSSARFDGQNYWRAIGKIQGWLARRALNRLVRLVARELMAARQIRARNRLLDRELVWIWPAVPHVDPKKEADAMEVRRRNGTVSITDELRSQGRDLQQHVRTLARERRVFGEQGVPYPEPQPAGPAADSGDRDDEEADRGLPAVGSEAYRRASWFPGLQEPAAAEVNGHG